MVSYRTIELREKAIQKIVKTLIELEINNLKYDKEKFMYEIQGEFHVSRKTASDYLMMAHYENNRRKEKTNRTLISEGSGKKDEGIGKEPIGVN